MSTTKKDVVRQWRTSSDIERLSKQLREERKELILPKGPSKILSYLALKKHGNRYEISKCQNLSYSWTHTLIKRLLKQGFIREEEREKAPTGLEKCSYTLTIAGVIKVLAHKPIYNKIDLVAKNYAHMFPLVFGKWDFFIKEDKRDAAIRRIIETILFFQNYVPGHFIAEWTTTDDHVEQWQLKLWRLIPPLMDVVHDFAYIFLAAPFTDPPHFPNPDAPLAPELKGWFETLRKDSDLKAFVNKVYKEKEEGIKGELQTFMSWKNWWENLG